MEGEGSRGSSGTSAAREVRATACSPGRGPAGVHTIREAEAGLVRQLRERCGSAACCQQRGPAACVQGEREVERTSTHPQTQMQLLSDHRLAAHFPTPSSLLAHAPTLTCSCSPTTGLLRTSRMPCASASSMGAAEMGGREAGGQGSELGQGQVSGGLCLWGLQRPNTQQLFFCGGVGLGR